MRGLPGYQPVMVKRCEKIVSPAFHFVHLLNEVPKSQYFIHNSQYTKKYSYTFFGFWLQLSGLSKKIPKNVCFWFKSVLKLEILQIKSQFLAKLLVFWNVIWKDGSLLALENQTITYLWASFHSIFVHTRVIQLSPY